MAKKRNKWRFLELPLKSRLKRNTVTNILFFILTFPLMFIITPMILRHVGKEAYGIWALTGTILIFVELLGGIQTPSALSIMIPKYNPKKDYDEINSVLNTMFVFYLAAGAVFSVIYFFTENSIISVFFKVSENSVELVKFVLGVSFYLFILNFILMSFGYVLGSFNLFYINNILHVISSYVRVGLMIAALLLGYGIKGIVIAQMGVLILETIVVLVCVKLVFPPFKVDLKLYNASKLNYMVRLSFKLFFTRAAVLVNYNVDKLILGYFINPVVAAYYQIGANITKFVAQVPEILGLSALLPAASELKAKKEIHKIAVLYERVNKYMFFCAMLLMSGIIIFGKEFIYLWLGGGYEKVYTVMLFLSLGYTYGLFGYPAMHLLNGIEKVKQTMVISGLMAAINIVLSIYLTAKYGLTGALIGTLIATFIGASAFAMYYYAVFKHTVNLIDIFLKPVIALVLAYFSVDFITDKAGIVANWLFFFIKVSIFSVVYVGVSLLLRHFDTYDIGLVEKFIPFKKKI